MSDPDRFTDTGAQRRHIVIVMLVAFNLRGALVAVAPVLDEIRDDIGLSSATAGLLTTLPVLCFAALSPAAARLARRWGIERVLTAAMLLLLGGVLMRLAHPTAALFAGTAALGAAMAAGNVLLPALTKRDFPTRVGDVTGAYVTVMSAGATVAAGTTVVLQHVTELGWRGTLALWAIPAVAAVAALRAGARDRQHGPQIAAPASVVRNLYRDPLAWHVTVFMGVQSLIYYASVAWLPTLFISEGASASHAGLLLGLMNLAGLPASLAVPMLAGRHATQTHLVIATSIATGAGLLGVVFAPTTAPVPWMILLGAGQGATIGLALAMIGLRSPDSEHASQLSSMAQGSGYLIAALGPVALGVVHTLTGNWATAFAVTLVALGVQLLSGLGAARDLLVGRVRA